MLQPPFEVNVTGKVTMDTGEEIIIVSIAVFRVRICSGFMSKFRSLSSAAAAGRTPGQIVEAEGSIGPMRTRKKIILRIEYETCTKTCAIFRLLALQKESWYERGLCHG